jgi:NDP-sugar pyrophosphorylase family protein
VARPADERLAVERISRDEMSRGAETILLLRSGPYIEFDLDDILRFHRASFAALTIVRDCNGDLPFWVLSADRVARDGSSGDAIFGAATSSYLLNGYANRLANPSQLRQLVRDGFERRCRFMPRGGEMKPGIWIGNGARIDRDARLTEPVFIGRNARVRSSAVVAQFSHVEYGSVVESGSIVAHSSVFARTRIGKGLDVVNSVVDGGRLASLKRNVVVEVNDPSIFARLDPWRLLRLSYKPHHQPVFGGEAEEITAPSSFNLAAVPVPRSSAKE